MRAVAVGLVAVMPLLTPRLGTEWLSQIRAALERKVLDVHGGSRVLHAAPVVVAQ